jgi:toxin-antitoxin system PIN domain toxin
VKAHPRTALLDINVLVALFFAEHVHHEVAHDWFADNAHHGWATCPITQNGFVRVAAQLRPGNTPLRAATAAQHLIKFVASDHHHFWPDAVSLLDPALFRPVSFAGPRQLTDVYLLGLARKMRGHLVTFDTGITSKAVVGASGRHVTVIRPG